MRKPLNIFTLKEQSVIDDVVREFTYMPVSEKVRQDAEDAIKVWFDTKLAAGQFVIAFINVRVSHAVVTFKEGELALSWRTQPVDATDVAVFGGRVYLGVFREHHLYVNTATKRVVATNGRDKKVAIAEAIPADSDSPLRVAYCRACALGIYIGNEEF